MRKSLTAAVVALQSRNGMKKWIGGSNMKNFLVILFTLFFAHAALGDVRTITVDGYCYLEGQSIHWGTKVKFIEGSPSAVTDSTYTDSLGYFLMAGLHEGIYDVEYTHSTDYDTVIVEDQVLGSSTTLPPVTLDWVLVDVDGHCYLENETIHWGTKVKFIEVSPSAVTDSTYTDSLGYFVVTGLYEGIYDVEYTHAGFDTVVIEDQILVSSTTLAPMTLERLPLSGALSGTLEPGCYHVVGTISINSGDSLSLLPGTTFIFDGPYPFRIYGTLLAEGTESDSIVFTTEQSGSDRWRGLQFYDPSSSGSRLAYCLVEKVNGGSGIGCGSSSPTFTNCTINANRGIGVTCDQSSPTFTNCTISHNTSSGWGAGVGVGNSSAPVFYNCIIYSNSAVLGGGGMEFVDAGNALVNHCTIVGNSSGSWNMSQVSIARSPITLENSVIAFSDIPGICFEDAASSSVRYCDIFGNSEGNIVFFDDPSDGPPGIGQISSVNANGDSCDSYFNIFLDPLFADMAEGDFHLMDFSHCLGAGNPADTVSTDFEGDPRPNPPGSFPDIGADENPNAQPQCGLSGHLQGVLGPDTCHVIDAIYVDSGDSLTLLPGTVFIFDGPYPFRIYGTLLAEGTETDSIVFTTEQSGSDRWRGLRFHSGSSGSQFGYCLIENGLAVGDHPDSNGYGGGVACRESSPIFTNCTIRSNSANLSGGGLQCHRSSPTFTSCTFSSNIASGYGGGADCGTPPSPTFTNCSFAGNFADKGGGVYCWTESSPTFTNCTLSGNSALEGGGVYCWESSPTLNSTIIAFSGGVGIYFYGSPISQIEYCDIFGNSGGDIAFHNDDPSQGPPAIGQLLVTNTNADSADIYLNIFCDPMFADTAAGDYHLTDSSHCLGAGDPADTLSTDFEGDPRPNPSWSYPDIGADEHWSGSPVLHLVISISDNNAVLHWTPYKAGPYYIYGATTPFDVGELLDTVTDAAIWTDSETSSRPSPCFYYVTGEEAFVSNPPSRRE